MEEGIFLVVSGHGAVQSQSNNIRKIKRAGKMLLYFLVDFVKNFVSFVVRMILPQSTQRVTQSSQRLTCAILLTKLYLNDFVVESVIVTDKGFPAM
jgi:hypothetical protein